ncbi:hypothetical protein [Streptomyces sp. NBC_00829]|uniref:hypothetical protein n=1 Tax=Streptomyces sp. NBC_00829 TaxID=2903679 RepID=UPI00386D8EF2|nr:hypothetical protein OG293_19995 [Streptomyces sp. NBC_00829]
MTVPEQHPHQIAEINAHWHRLAVEYGAIGKDGVFVVDVAESRSGISSCERALDAADEK